VSLLPRPPQVNALAGPFGTLGCALTVDVEEWYHTCLVPDFVDPARRPTLPRELDRLLPATLELLAAHRCRATFFTLGEVARELPARVREIAAAGHEVASHGLHHLRVARMEPRRFRADLERAKKSLEDLLGEPVDGYRAPEWSLREVRNPRLRIVAELGFRYDSSLAPCLGSGRRDNPRAASELSWEDGRTLVELPPLTFGGRWQLPAGGWPGRLAGGEVVARAARAHRREGGMPVLVIHPWELAARPLPGELTGLARWIHETGRDRLRADFPALLDALPWRSVREALGERTDVLPMPILPAPDLVAAPAVTTVA
jgi:polysaccharide deacetylase family protein (PEP-CTERM system associated)